MITKLLAVFLSILFFVTTPTIADTLELSNYTNHWIANTGGGLDDHIQNFISDMVVYNNEYSTFPSGQMILTGSAWDEGHCGYCGIDIDNGVPMGSSAFTVFLDETHSDTARFGSTTCHINNFWARASYFKGVFVGNIGPPPSGSSAPNVSCSNGDTLRSVIDPSALAFDMSGNLLVADNGPDQNIKIFSLAPFTLIRTFGDSGGVFARSKRGRIGFTRGVPAPKRFWGIRGLGVDSSGNIYVANTGIVEQAQGGTNIRKFSGIDSSLVWENHGVSFVNSADADPASGGTSIDISGKRFTMDYSKAPGLSWKLSGVSLDQFRWVNDSRNYIVMESVWTRRIQGKKFIFSTNMYGDFLAVVRFTDTSEIGIPTAFFCLRTDLTTSGNNFITDSAPYWERNETNKRNRWYWIDRNGDGIAQSSEYGIYTLWNIFSQSVSVDEVGNIWHGGTGNAIETFGGDGGLMEIIAGPLDVNGVPTFNMGNIKHYNVPFTARGGEVVRIKHLVANDMMFLASSPNSYAPDSIHVYSRFKDTTQRELVCVVDLKFDDLGEPEIILDDNSGPMTIPWSFTADHDYIYVAYLDNGRFSRRRGEVTIYSSKTCQPVGWIAPTASTDYFSGAVDLLHGINVADQPGGYKIIMVEEDGAGKVMVYRWHP